MTYAGAISTIDAHLVAAGTAVSPAVTDIGVGEPGVPPGRCTRYWYAGETEPPHFPGGRTFTDEIVAERIAITTYWPVSSRDKPLASALEDDVRAWVRAIRNRLIGDRTLGGNVVDSAIGRAEAGWLQIDNAAWRVASLEVVIEFVDLDTIGP